MRRIIKIRVTTDNPNDISKEALEEKLSTQLGTIDWECDLLKIEFNIETQDDENIMDDNDFVEVTVIVRKEAVSKYMDVELADVTSGDGRDMVSDIMQDSKHFRKGEYKIIRDENG